MFHLFYKAQADSLLDNVWFKGIQHAPRFHNADQGKVLPPRTLQCRVRVGDHSRFTQKLRRLILRPQRSLICFARMASAAGGAIADSRGEPSVHSGSDTRATDLNPTTLVPPEES